jgi:hypothetical protein
MIQREVVYPAAGSQLAFARVATALTEGRLGRLSIGELDVDRLRVRELVVEEKEGL